ncbi:MAG: hypothetical protein AAGG02_03425 [Cyanobacteria bacterium P01_H01_bin.15]
MSNFWIHHSRKVHNVFFAATLLAASLLANIFVAPAQAQQASDALTLPDLSGLVWVEGDVFLGVHDAKRSSENPRISIVQLPNSELKGVTWRTLDLMFPGPAGLSNDLESASRIPGTNAFLFAESGQDGDRAPRIFLSIYDNETLKIKSYLEWPVPINNVESIAVSQIAEQLVFIYAERADSLPTTKLRWATLSLNPFKLEKFDEITYQGVDPVGKGARPIVALDVDSEGFIYIVSAYDPGSDDGPFRSVVWRVGKISGDENGNPQIELSDVKRLANLDGLKVESITVRELPEEGKQIYIGTDDEHYGGIIRLLPDVF